MASTRFGKILRDAKTLTDSSNKSDISNKSDKPQLERELGQIASESLLLKSKLNADQGLNTTGHYFLAQSGVNAQEVGEKLKRLDTRITFQLSEQFNENDIEVYMKEVRKYINEETTDEGKRNTRNEFLDRCDKSMHSNTRKLHRDIFEDWDLEQEEMMFGRATLGNDKHANFKKQKTSYASIIKHVNEKRLLSEKIDIIQEFKSLSNNVECDKSQKKLMGDAWAIASDFSKRGYLFDIVHLKNRYDISETVKMNRHLIQAAKSYLEKEFLSYINEILQQKAREAKVGGAPDLRLRIRAFVNLEFKKGDHWKARDLEIVDDTPIWLMVYVYLRIGNKQLALEFVDNGELLYTSAPQFPTYIREYLSSPNGIVEKESRQAILSDYQRMVYGEVSADPYKILLYKIIGRCEIQNESSPNAINTIEDYMWLQLTLVREQVYEERYSYEAYRLSDLQRKINSSGRSHFDPNNTNPWFYFKILLLSAQLEKAVEFLYSVDNFRLEAVHFGIALVYNELIRIPSKPCDEYANLLVEELDGSVCLNFIRLINQYVRLFVADDSDTALHYLYLITLYPTEDMMALCREQICSYIIRHNSYATLFGSGDSNPNQPQSGSPEKYKQLVGINSYDLDQYRNAILTPIAQKLQWRGNYEDSVKIFELSEQYIDAIKVLNRQLDYALSRRPEGLELAKRQKSDQRLMEFSVVILKNYKSSINVYHSNSVLLNHDILFKFLQATTCFESGNYSATIEAVKSTRILPQTTDDKTVKVAVDTFNANIDLSIRKHLSQILVMTMESYDKLKEAYSRHSTISYALNQMNLETIYKETTAILMFVSLIDFHIPSEIVKKLNQLDIKRY